MFLDEDPFCKSNIVPAVIGIYLFHFHNYLVLYLRAALND